jgi:hypothetical protein
MSLTRPSLADLMPVDDTSSPLSHSINNPDLKFTRTHNFGIGFRFSNDSTRHFLNINTNASITQNAIGTRIAYNSATGASTYMQDNINGNWNWNLSTNYEQPIDSAKHFTLEQRASANYTHSVDFEMAYEQTVPFEDITFGRSTVHNWTINEHLGVEYQKEKLTIGISGDVSWRRSTSHRQNFESISAFDYNYGGLLRYTIPWLELSVATDLRMYSRRGYQSEMMNTDDLVWNAELARSFFKEKLTLKFTAFDLLHRLSNKQYSINAQGRTETWNNCIPRYLMLSVAYKFNAKPKSK